MTRSTLPNRGQDKTLPAVVEPNGAKPSNEPEVITQPKWQTPLSILITQCAQRDFLRLLGEGESTPTLVHVGRQEAIRLCGPAGTLLEFLVLAHQSKPEVLAIINICDEHDSVKDADHLDRFGTHCQKDKPGAKLIGSMDELVSTRPNTFRVAAGDLNDCHDTDILNLLRRLLEGRDLADVKIGVVGVWTDVKVAFLIRDLITELGAKNVATCSSLTASNDIENHFAGLVHLRNVLGVQVFHSHVGLLNWLDPTAEVRLPKTLRSKLEFSDTSRFPGTFSSAQLDQRDALIASTLEQVEPGQTFELKPLAGGFSGSQVFVAKSPNKVVVAKVGPRDEVAHERFANERMVRRLRGYVPKILAYREGPGLAVLVQELAKPKSEEIEGPLTFQELAQKDLDPRATALLKNSLTTLFDRAMVGTTHSASIGTADLFREYGFTDARARPQWGKSVTRNALAIYRRCGFETAEDLYRHVGLEGPLCSMHEFYRTWLPGRTFLRDTLRTDVHGDLNLVNILLSRIRENDTPENLWVIDFARLSKLPALTDFAKIENDLSYIVLPIRNSDDFIRALKIQEARLNSPTLDVSHIAKLGSTPEEKRYVELLKHLRTLAIDVDDRGEEAMNGYRVALLRYAAHTLGFTEPNHAQRMLALCGCGRLAGLIREEYNRNKLLE